MAGQLDLFGAESAEAEERPDAGKGRASARPEPSRAPTLAEVLADEKQNPARAGFDSAAEAVGGGKPEHGSPPSLPQALASVADVLRAIAELVPRPNRWCQGCSARDRHGRPAIPGTREAVRLSAYGAFALLRHGGRIPDAVNMRVWFVLNEATKASGYFARWHDLPTTSHADVLTLLFDLSEGTG